MKPPGAKLSCLQTDTTIMVPILLILIDVSGVVNKVPVAVHTLFGIAWPGIDHRPMGQHGPPFLRDVKQIPVALLALLVLEGSIGLLAVFFMIVCVLREMNGNVLHAIPGLGVEKVHGIVRSGQVTIHAVGHKALGVVHMS